MVELPTYTRTNNLHVPAAERQVLRTKDKGAIAIPGRERIDKQGVPQTQIPKSLKLERKEREMCLLTENYRDQEEMTSVRFLTLAGFCQFS